MDRLCLSLRYNIYIILWALLCWKVALLLCFIGNSKERSVLYSLFTGTGTVQKCQLLSSEYNVQYQQHHLLDLATVVPRLFFTKFHPLVHGAWKPSTVWTSRSFTQNASFFLRWMHIWSKKGHVRHQTFHSSNMVPRVTSILVWRS